MDEFNIDQLEIKKYNSIVIGSGAAGLNCALHLVMEGISPENVAIVTDNLGGGTSFNAGSDKQTYYKMSISGDQSDSPYDLAKDLYAGGAMHGDIALIEATNSIREFFHLVQLGVPFPHDKYGGFVGYKTDNDPRQRATSIGPSTSQEMGKCLLKAVQDNNIRIFDKHYAIKIIIDDASDKARANGLICIKTDVLSKEKNIENLIDALKIFRTNNVILATGGPAILYKNSVYPRSQTGTASLAIEAGCKFQNLTESQFGLASTKFRWNVSGSYQQVIPRYFSIDGNNTEREFLSEIFPSFKELSQAVFLKGYQWPFNAARIEKYGSSLIDLAVYHESEVLNRRVFLDYTKNPKSFEFNDLFHVAKSYLNESQAIGDIPIDRLRKLNEQAILIYRKHNIDLKSEPLEISVCNQHLNGGVSCDTWWESTTVNNLFAVGEINGSHGIHRPGGAALNAGQVGGLRAAQKIAYLNQKHQSITNEHFNHNLKRVIINLVKELSILIKNIDEGSLLTAKKLLDQIQDRMSKYGAIFRPLKDLDHEISIIQNQFNHINKISVIKNNTELIEFFQVKDALLTQLIFLKAILDYHHSLGRSRGSYLILRNKLDESVSERYVTPPGNLKNYRFILNNLDLSNKIQTIQWKDGKILVDWEDVRGIPSKSGWFENIWKKFEKKEIYD